MKYITEVYDQGNLVARSEQSDEYDFEFLEKEYEGLIEKYLKQGYTSEESCTSGYNLLFNRSNMKSAVISCKQYQVSDYLDADGKNIILDHQYTGKIWYPKQILYPGQTYDIYEIHMDINHHHGVYRSFQEMKEDVYIRNKSRWSPRIIDTPDGKRMMSGTVGDIYGKKLNQKFIDSLELHLKE